MKKIFILFMLCSSSILAFSQNNIAAPIGVYTPSYFSDTKISNGGNVLVGNGGVWGFGGNITSADKGNDNSPNAIGRSEIITFENGGTYSNAATNSGTTGNIVDGYAGAQGQSDVFTLPIGANGTGYPVEVPASGAAVMAYFVGSGSEQNTSVTNLNGSTTEYSPYFDVENMSEGNYLFAYPSGFSSDPASVVLESGGTSSTGTTSSTMYNLLVKLSSNFTTTANYANVPVGQAYNGTQVYFGTNAEATPVKLLGLVAALQDNNVLLSWETATEINNKGFEIERSADRETWSNIGYVSSKSVNGNSAAQLSYSYTDNAPLMGTNYYRLIQQDLNGDTAISNTVSVNVLGVNNIIVYPNPTMGQVRVSGIQLGDVVRVYNSIGQTVANVTATGNAAQIDLSNEASGVYFIIATRKNIIIQKIKIIRK